MSTYPRYVEAPSQWASVAWTGSNLDEIKDFFATHEISGTVMQAETTLLIIQGSSYTYATGEQVIAQSDDGPTWRLEPARRTLDGLVPRSTFYVDPAGPAADAIDGDATSTA